MISRGSEEENGRESGAQAVQRVDVAANGRGGGVA